MRTKAIFDNIAEHLEEQIDLAENKIVVAVAWFTNKRLFDALCKKAADGVKVKLIIDDNEINRNSTINHSDIQIGKSKLYWIETHNKFCIIDDYILITGSYNWSYRAESNSENILICSGNIDLVKEYKNEVKKIIKDYLPEDNIKPKSRWEEAIKSGRIKPYVPPGLKLKGHITPTERPSIKNDFESIKIGEQEWLVKNLDVDKFRNGDVIPHALSDKDWEIAGKYDQPAWCYVDNNSENGKIYGKLYNWYAVNDKRGLAPAGWHVPSDAEWTTLTTYLGGESVAGNKMIPARTAYCDSPIIGFTNESGFSVLPGGVRSSDGSFISTRREYALFWSATEFDYGSKAWCRFLDFGGWEVEVERVYDFKRNGYSVRCIKSPISSNEVQVIKSNYIKPYVPPGLKLR